MLRRKPFTILRGCKHGRDIRKIKVPYTFQIYKHKDCFCDFFFLPGFEKMRIEKLAYYERWALKATSFIILMITLAIVLYYELNRLWGIIK